MDALRRLFSGLFYYDAPDDAPGAAPPHLSLKSWAEKLLTKPRHTKDIFGIVEFPHMTKEMYYAVDNVRLGLAEGEDKPELGHRLDNTFCLGHLELIGKKYDAYKDALSKDEDHKAKSFKMYPSVVKLHGKFYALGGHGKLKPENYGRNESDEICFREGDKLVPYLALDHPHFHVLAEGAFDDLTEKQELTREVQVRAALKKMFTVQWENVMKPFYEAYYKPKK